MPPRAHTAQHDREKKKAAGHRHEAAEAHDAETEVFAERAHVLLGAVLFASEPEGAGQRETEAEHRLPRTEEHELPADEPGRRAGGARRGLAARSEEHTSEL